MTIDLKRWTPEMVLDLRRRFHLRQEDLSQLTGLSVSAISRWEKSIVHGDTHCPGPAASRLLSTTERDLISRQRRREKGRQDA